MREILFRGKKIVCGKRTNEWEYGVPLMSNPNSELAYIKQLNSYEYQVDLETVGQYIGICDKNGTKIFEGDIVRATYNGEIEKYYQIIFYNGGYKMKCNNCQTIYDYSIHDEHPEFEVIGNIYDNPELLDCDANNKM